VRRFWSRMPSTDTNSFKTSQRVRMWLSGRRRPNFRQSTCTNTTKLSSLETTRSTAGRTWNSRRDCTSIREQTAPPTSCTELNWQPPINLDGGAAMTASMRGNPGHTFQGELWSTVKWPDSWMRWAWQTGNSLSSSKLPSHPQAKDPSQSLTPNWHRWTFFFVLDVSCTFEVIHSLCFLVHLRSPQLFIILSCENCLIPRFAHTAIGAFPTSNQV